jgi:hypothetical protein
MHAEGLRQPVQQSAWGALPWYAQLAVKLLLETVNPKTRCARGGQKLAIEGGTLKEGQKEGFGQKEEQGTGSEGG